LLLDAKPWPVFAAPLLAADGFRFLSNAEGAKEIAVACESPSSLEAGTASSKACGEDFMCEFPASEDECPVDHSSLSGALGDTSINELGEDPPVGKFHVKVGVLPGPLSWSPLAAPFLVLLLT
jgi:hypothetical protein